MGISTIAWGAKVSDTFLDRVKWIVDDLNIGYSLEDGCSKLMACMAWESGESFAPDKRNMAGSGATGLIQFMPSTARALGTTVDKLAAMTAEDQLNYVWKYFEPYRDRLKTLADIYMAILWPKAVGKSETYVLWDRSSMPTTYRQNSGIDIDKDGVITKAEAAAKVAGKLSKGLSPGNVLETLLTPFKGEPTEQAVLPSEPDAVYVEEAPMDTVPTKGSPELVQEVTEDADYTYTTEAKPQTKTEAVKHAASSVEAKIMAILLILGSLFANADFASKLGQFTTGVARGEASWSALVSLIGLALLAYSRSSPPRT